MSEILIASRRRFLASSSAVLAFTLAASSLPARGSTLQLASRNTLVLYRAHDSLSQQFASEFALAGYSARQLTDDPVRQWRDELYNLVINANFRLAGLGNWADFSILRGLAAESRRFPEMVIQHDKYQPAQAEWPVHHARALLAQECLKNNARLALYAENLNKESIINGGQPRVFSWII